MKTPSQSLMLIAALGMVAIAACDAGETLSNPTIIATDWAPTIDPSDFGGPIDNQYFPLIPGIVFMYASETDEGTEIGKVVVTSDTRVIVGVTTIVVLDSVFLDGELIEATADWYAQDDDGNVWYFGEDSEEWEDGMLVSTEGSWEADLVDQFPGIIMLADPKIGQKYHQEFAPEIAEDMGQVLSRKKSVSVPAGDYENCLQTMDWTPLEPGHRELKYYCPGVGLVLEVVPREGRRRNELVSVN